MDVYRRYFKIIQGPVTDFIKDAIGINNRAHEEYKKILSEIGAELKYYIRDGKICGIIFSGAPHPFGFYKKLRYGGWWPKKNHLEGKKLDAKIKSVKTKNPNDALKLIGLSTNPSIFSNGKCYFSTLTVIPEEIPTVYISVPWFDVDPEKLSEYKRLNDEGKMGDLSMDSILWEPSPDMVEVKRWQVDKHIEDWNSKINGQ